MHFHQSLVAASDSNCASAGKRSPGDTSIHPQGIKSDIATLWRHPSLMIKDISGNNAIKSAYTFA